MIQGQPDVPQPVFWDTILAIYPESLVTLMESHDWHMLPSKEATEKKQDQWRQTTINVVGGTAYDSNELIIVHLHPPYFRKKKRRLTRFVKEGK